MRHIQPIILFLDEDLETSARYLTNFHLEHGIRTTCQVLMCTLYYLLGYRTKFLFRHHFCKERWDDTRFRDFPSYPLKSIPKYTFYTSPEARWCRKSASHYNLLVEYLGFMLDEYVFRKGGQHQLQSMLGFFSTVLPEIALRRGILFPFLKDEGKLQLPWKNLPVQYRRKDIIQGYRLYYESIIISPLDAFIGTRRDVPEFLVGKMKSLMQ